MTASTANQGLTKIASYDLLETIGEGSMATVYKARHRDTMQVVAIKMIRSEWISSPVLCRRFEHEFQAARSVKHPHIVQVHDFGIDGAVPYIVMELVKGRSLRERLLQDGPLPEEEAVRMIVQVADALRVAHQHHYIHRDIKPDNIMFSGDGHAKLADLGLVKCLDADVNLTQGCGMIGTPFYAAPEQFEDPQHVDCRADVYGLGATLYSAVTGEIPFFTRTKGNYLTVLKKKLLNELTPPRKKAPQLSKTVDFAIRRAVRADKTQRHCSCEEFIISLTDQREPGEESPERIRHQEARRRPVERRAAVRFETARDLRCEPLAFMKEKSWPARICDISTHGIRLMLARRFEPGTVLLLDLAQGDKDILFTPLVRLVRVTKSKPKRWDVAGVFLRPLTSFELNSFLNS